MRAVCCGLVFLLAGGCASGGSLPRRTVPKVILSVLVVGGAALAVGAAIKSNSIEDKLADDYKQRELSGREFASRDAEGERWNRVARASTFVGGLSLLGLGILWEMSLGDRTEQGVSEKPPVQGPIFPVPPSAAAAPVGLQLPPPRHISAAAR